MGYFKQWQRKFGYFGAYKTSSSTQGITNSRALSHQNLGTCNQNIEQVLNCCVRLKQEAFSLFTSRDHTFKVSLWALSPSRILWPPPMRSSMPWWMLCREELNCRDSSIGMVVSESYGKNTGTLLTWPPQQLLGSHHTWLLCHLAKAKSEQPDRMMPESQNTTGKKKQSNGMRRPPFTKKRFPQDYHCPNEFHYSSIINFCLCITSSFKKNYSFKISLSFS